MNELALFAGAGGGILGGKLLGWRTVCAVEWDAYAAAVLCARQNDGVLPAFPIWDDVQTFDGRPWRGRVDVVSGGFPCQDISAAGKGAGIDGERSGMWRHMARIIREVGPRYVFVENSPMLVSRGLGVVLGDLAALGYDARWGVLGAFHAGAPHRRERIWIVATVANAQRVKQRQEALSYGCAAGVDEQAATENRREGSGATSGCSRILAHADSLRELQPKGSERDERRRAGDSSAPMANTDGVHEQGQFSSGADAEGWAESGQRPLGSRGDGGEWWLTEPDVGRVAHGVAARVDRLRCLGNGQVPAVAALAWETLTS